MPLKRSFFPFRTVHVNALVLCTVFLPWSTAFLSMAQMLLAANWFAEGIAKGTMRERLRSAFTTAPSLVFLSFLLLHVVGLLWTQDMAWGIDLGRILFPVLVFGAVLAGSPRLSRSELRIILLFGAWSAVACALFGVLFNKGAADDYRALSIFISHIRLALLLCIAVVIFLHYRSVKWWVNAAQYCGALLAVYFLDRLGSIQGFVILALIASVMLLRRSRRWGTVPRWALRISVAVVPIALVAAALALIDARHEPIPADLAARVEYTAGGERYYHDTTNTQTENGTHVWTYLAWGELRRAWVLRSDRTLDDLDDKGHPLWSTTVRYLASKGMLKDSASVMALSDDDVRAIEHGMSNALHDQRGSIRVRMEEVLFELDLYRNKGLASGHSVTMRIEFQKAGWALAKANWLYGVGTGDTQRAFDAYYTAARSTLEPQWRLRAHNEYLTLWISFGIFGLLWSLCTWYWPAYKLGAWKQPLFIAWAIAFGVSCFTDDTIETQAGATFFALYYALFVFAAPKAQPIPTDPVRVIPGSA
ncbi:MAG: O-antigen ligase family protein [Flavobacteriales bacterium]|nr:O-antigen ligase family protein [Flavobacteriales bacterium]